MTGDGRQSLREIWQGATLAAQRRALEEGSYDLRCQQRVVDELSCCRVEFVTAEPERVWREILDRLEAQPEHPVEIVVRSARTLNQTHQDELRAALRREHGSDPLVATADDAGLVTAVDEPAWATWLGASGFVGHPMEQLGHPIQERFGNIEVAMVPTTVPGVDSLAIRIDTSAGPKAVRMSRFLDERSRCCRAFVTQIDVA